MGLRNGFGAAIAAALLAAAHPAAGQTAPATQSFEPPRHTSGWPGMASGRNQYEADASLKLGPQLERDRSAKFTLAEHRRLTRALGALLPQRKGVVDAYVIAAGLDSDPVFGRETREAAKVLSRRYDAAGRTILLAGTDGKGPSALPMGSVASLTMALARVAEVMDPNEDVLVLYTTSHGAKVGAVYHDGDQGYGLLAPERLAALLDELGIKRRLLMISACYSGVFVPALATPDTALLTAASSERPSFGCAADNDWTFFGDALINHAMRKPQPLTKAVEEAHALIGNWEAKGNVEPSQPQASVGDKVSLWLTPLEARSPKAATQPVGRPATDALRGE